MNVLASRQLNVKGEAKAIGFVLAIAVLLAAALLVSGFVTPAAIVVGFGVLAVFERFHRLSVSSASNANFWHASVLS